MKFYYEYTYTFNQLEFIANLASNQCVLPYVYTGENLLITREEIQELLDRQAIKIAEGEKTNLVHLTTLEREAVSKKCDEDGPVYVLSSVIFESVYRHYWSWRYKSDE